MKFFLTLYICSAVSGECVSPKPEAFDYKRQYDTHYGCVRAGLGDSFELLFNGEIFSANVIETYEIYPKFSCDKNLVPPQKPVDEKQPTSLI